MVIALACRNLPPQREEGHLLGRGRRDRPARRADLLRGIAAHAAVPQDRRRAGAALDRHQADRCPRTRTASHDIEGSATLVGAVKTVIVADLVMSLDNVIGVAGAAKGSVALLIFGLVVSIPLVVVGSQLILKLIERFPLVIARRRRCSAGSQAS